MFNINKDIVCKIILRVKEINVADDSLIADNSVNNTSNRNTKLAENKNDLTSTELRTAINKLEPDQQKQLIALMFIGRGDYEKDQWDDAMEEANNVPVNKRTDYLITKPLLASYLEEGLSKFGYFCE